MWQDGLLAFGSVVLAYALIPTITGSHKPHLKTSIATAITLLSFEFAYASLGMWITVVLNIVIIFEWCLLVYQKLKIKRDAKNGNI